MSDGTGISDEHSEPSVLDLKTDSPQVNQEGCSIKYAAHLEGTRVSDGTNMAENGELTDDWTSGDWTSGDWRKVSEG